MNGEGEEEVLGLGLDDVCLRAGIRSGGPDLCYEGVRDLVALRRIQL